MLRPDLDQSQLSEAMRLTDLIYRLHEAGQPNDAEIAQLSAIANVEITRSDVCGAFGTWSSENWAHDLILLSQPLPSGLSRDDLIGMIRVVSEASGPEWLAHWYLRCLEHATGCDTLTDLLDSPEELTPEEVLDRALNSRRRVLIPPPPVGIS